MTHPTFRQKGYATAGLRQAEHFFRDNGAAHGLLVCEAALLPYYGSLGWKHFEGQLLTAQFGEKREFTFNEVMMLDVAEMAPETGVIDLLGPPW